MVSSRIYRFYQAHSQKVTDEGDSSCQACILGKSTRRPFVNLSQNRYAPLQAVSSDTTGPISEQDIEGNKYLQLIANESTGYIAGDPMKTNSGASAAIHRTPARLQLLCGRRVQRFHADNFNEQDSGIIKEFLDTQGTQPTFTEPTSSPSKAIVDRRFESIFAAARTTLKVAPAPLNAL